MPPLHHHRHHTAVSLDVVLELVFNRYYGWKGDVHDQLREAFMVFDEDRNGLELPEFKARRRVVMLPMLLCFLYYFCHVATLS